jgi:hypothetical protein
MKRGGRKGRRSGLFRPPESKWYASCRKKRKDRFRHDRASAMSLKIKVYSDYV